MSGTMEGGTEPRFDLTLEQRADQRPDYRAIMNETHDAWHDVRSAPNAQGWAVASTPDAGPGR